ncbi:MAG: SDR family NAD(P)-dependent oxidoreductase, partial [Isosphaeraceae bacterium]|nr:SDR family NAD(P)-dependent oxidoreductase [Isosphaeraceae bacterium]
IKPEHLGLLRTLGDIIDFLAQDTNPKTPSIATTSHSHTNGAHAENGLAHALQPTSVSDPLLRFVPRPSLLADSVQRELVALRPGAEVWVGDDGTELAAALAEVIRARGLKPRVIGRQEISSIEIPSDLDGLVLLGSGGDDAVKDSFRLLHRAGPALRRAGKKHGAVFITVSRLDGAFGLRRLSIEVDATPGALAGIAKTAAHEWPDVNCKAIDVDRTWVPAQEVAGAIAEELFARGPVEVGLSKDGPTAIELASSALTTGGGIAVLERGDVVVISGGARGVTAEVALALAEAFQPTVVLLGRSPAPEPEPQWLASLSAEAEIKKALASRANGHASPQVVGEQFRLVAASREIVQNVERIQQTGARVVYRSVDVRDPAAVRRCVDAIENEFGPVRGLVHGAGVLADRRIEDQSDEQFGQVYDTKVLGLRSLLAALHDADLKALVLFSSSTARFGRTGQVAYAAANEVLNKTAQHEAIARPSCRVLSINWGPWDGGMVTTALKPLFHSEGIGLIPLRSGAEYLVDELRNSEADRPVEVVILGPGSTVELGSKGAPRGTATPSLAAVFEREVTVEALPILSAHVIDGRPVLPMALTLEWLAQGAAQRNPGLVFAGFSELRLLKGVVLRAAQPEVVRVLAGKAVRKGNYYAAPVDLTGKFADGHEVAHARGEVLLAERYTAENATIELPHLPRLGTNIDEVYRGTLFHGPMLQGIERIEASGEPGIAAFVATSPPPLEWITRPLRNSWLSDPLAIDSAFQLLIVWCAEQLGAGSLPTRFAGYRQFRKEFPAEGVRVVARVVQTSPHKAIAEIEFLDHQGALVARFDEYECVIDASLNDAFRRNQAIPIAPR